MKTLALYITEQQNENRKEFMIIKPGFLDDRNDIIDYLKRHKVIVIRELRKKLTLSEAKKIYKMHNKESFYEDLCKYMSSDDSIGFILCNYGPYSMDELKKDIRKQFGIDDMKNAIHSSDSPLNAYRESKIYFSTSTI